ncbi:RNA polymerase sigma factor [Haliangium ochraceum]|uniref:RNA polymerase, sigma-24 subunit, ECF subfamily n=1 Tax=Haliangium ochraceum (strain DSM 14365 / JCM 11303 / SMP-2) TaxID=502025 RepID=D0LRW7_HALO1|nr:RNA polymerase sigma factor [Haliangium ochraceum]ACY19109.1 RNA polymerase, sigma-24 subunit, ECF subfamily [Haliangium ochraceum DSM 14365]
MARSNSHPEAAAALVARAKRGDDSAFGELVRRYRERIFALALHLTGRESDADDITQDVFLKAYRALESFEGRSEFFTWVYRMTVNRSLNVRRDRKRRSETTMDDPRVDRAVAVDAAGDPQRAAELRQTYTCLLAALDRLPASMRTSVVLVTLQGLSHAEAAVVQSCSPGTIAWRIHDARRRLRRALERQSPALRSAARALSDDQRAPDLGRLLQEWEIPTGLLPS